MRIEEDLKLGFKDVLIRPKRSTLKSRSDVQLEREFTLNILARPGLVCRSLLLTWTPSARLHG
jgi:hypothetical protein